jgi:undecaprenyl diphosphate synthase
LRIIGDISLLPQDVQVILRRAEAKTAHFTKKGFQMALGYGARDEILRGVNRAIEHGKTVTKEEFGQLLYTAEVPDPDLIIRTGGEVRLSNFLLYQAAYAELYFSDVMFPAFSDDELEKAFSWYSSRVRRFGKTDEQLQKGNVSTANEKE